MRSPVGATREIRAGVTFGKEETIKRKKNKCAYRFIGAVRAVRVAVTAPPDVDAVSGLAREIGPRRARGLLAVLLIAAISAIIIPIAGPALLDALAVGARELVYATRLVCA